ncbi:hypothetical protein EDB81DRAFT_53925 [Dactylonectria macrodidyma]|uniref:Protein kinase domain-containing protein n=1 Tax=Dactylonectria macrodidyma TaxID=307937 RepID=A0A9P9J3I1_9HYPO|nr:hypothetical protein EDB81DRAFT_53925 [Dactylonectria macrodidyma]
MSSRHSWENWALGSLQARPKIAARAHQLKKELVWYRFLALVQRRGMEVRRRAFNFLGDVVGAGGFFEVYRHKILSGDAPAFQNQLGQELPKGTMVAIKRIIPPRVGTSSADPPEPMLELTNEVLALTKPLLRQHQNIVELYCVVWEHRGTEDHPWPSLVVEYCSITLVELQREIRKPLSLEMKQSLLSGIGSGLDAIHEAGFIHGDLKPDNVLIRVEQDETLVPKLADFSCSVLTSSTDTFIQLGGTHRWMAPELVINHGRIRVDLGPGTDLYSFGLLMWTVIIDGRDPFGYLDEIYDSELCDNDLSERHKAIQELKVSNQIAKFAVHDCVAKLGEASSSSVFLNALLEADPETRMEECRKLSGMLRVSDILDGNDSGQHKLERSNQHDLSFEIDFLDMNFFLARCIEKENMRFDLKFGEEIRGKIFNELLSLMKKWLRDNSAPCPGCSATSHFDRLDGQQRLPELDDFIQFLKEADESHTCENMSRGWRTNLDSGMSTDEVFVAASNLFICYLEGYGTEHNVDEGLKWLMHVSLRGSLIRYELPGYFLRLKGEIPDSIPGRSWLMASVALQVAPEASRVLEELDPRLLRIAERTKELIFNGSLYELYTFATYDIFAQTSPQPQALLELVHQTCEHENGVIYSALPEAIGTTLLHRFSSCWLESAELCQAIAAKYPAILDAQDEEGATPLLLAARAGRSLMVTTLIGLGANVDLGAGADGDTPIHWLSVRPTTADALEWLLVVGANPNAIMRQIRMFPWQTPRHSLSAKFFFVGTPLHWAVLSDNKVAVKLLVQHGARVDMANVLGQSPCALAVALRNAPVLDLLLSSFDGAVPQNIIGSCFMELCQNNTEIARVAIGYAKNQEMETLEVILKHIVRREMMDEVNETFWRPVKFGIRAMDTVLLSRLMTAYGVALEGCIDGTPEIRHRPMSSSTWNNFMIDLSLHQAVRRGDPDILDLVIDKGLDISVIDILGNTCLHVLAIDGGSEPLLGVLLGRGADLSWKNNAGWTPLQSALLTGNVSLASCIAKLRCRDCLDEEVGSRSWRDEDGCKYTFLGSLIKYQMAFRSNLESVKWLLKIYEDYQFDSVFWGSSCPAQSILHLAVGVYEGETAPKGALQEAGRLPLVRFLLERFGNAACLKARIGRGEVEGGVSALHLAAFVGKDVEVPLIVDALERIGEDINLMSREFGTPLDTAFGILPNLLFYKKARERTLTREEAKRFVKQRNSIAQYLRSKGMLSRKELVTGTNAKTLPDDWIPFPNGTRPPTGYLYMIEPGRWPVRPNQYGNWIFPPLATPEEVLKKPLKWKAASPVILVSPAP